MCKEKKKEILGVLNCCLLQRFSAVELYDMKIAIKC